MSWFSPITSNEVVEYRKMNLSVMICEGKVKGTDPDALRSGSERDLL